MRRELTYNQVVQLLLRPCSDESLHQGITLLLFVHEVMQERQLNRDSFIFRQFVEGHILVSGIKESCR